MPGDIKVGGAFITYSAQAGPYVAGTNQVIAANRRVVASMLPLSEVADRFRASITASLIATAAYATGVGTVAVAFRSSVGSLLEFQEGLISIQKTTGLADEALGRLSERLVDINTTGLYGREAIGLLNRDILEIATAVGQAGITDVSEIAQLTQTAAALQVSSNLIGTDAVRALTRYLEVTGQGIERIDSLASAFTNLGNNAVATEAEIAEFARRIAQETSGVGRLSDQFILGLATTFVEAGARVESTSTVLQRSINKINELATDQTGFGQLGQLAGVAANDMEALRREFVEGVPTAATYERALTILLTALSEIPKAADVGPTFQGLLGAVFGESNTRVTATLGQAVQGFQNLERNIGLANEGIIESDFHFTEAEKASEAYRKQIDILSNQLSETGRDIAQVFLPSLIAIAQNMNIVAGAAAGLATSLALGFGGRAISNNLATQRRETADAAKSLKTLNQERLNNNRLFADAKNLRRSDLELQKEQRRLQSAIARDEREIANRRIIQTSPGFRRLETQSEAQDRVDRQEANRRAELSRQLAQADRQRAAVISKSSGTVIKDLNNEARVTKLTERAKRRLARAQERAAESTRIYNEQLRIARRNNNLFLVATRGLVNAFRTLLSPINLLIFALPVIGGALAKAFDSLGESERQVSEINDILEDLANADKPLSRLSAPVERLNELLNLQLEQIKELRNQVTQSELEVSPDDLFQTSDGFNSYRKQLEEAEAVYEDLLERARNLNIAIQETGESDTAVRRQVDVFKAFNQELALASRQVILFREQLDLGLQNDLESSRNQFIDANVAGLGQQAIIYREIRRNAINALEAEQQRLEIAARESQIAVTVRQQQVEAAQIALENTLLGDVQRDAAEKQLESAQNNLKTAEDDLEIRKEALSVGQEQLLLNRQDELVLQNIARNRREAALSQLRNFQPDFNLFDDVGVTEPARDTLQTLRNTVRERARDLDLQKEIQNLDDARAEAVTARVAAENQYLDTVESVEQSLQRQRRENQERAELIERINRVAEASSGKIEEDLVKQSRELVEQQYLGEQREERLRRELDAYNSQTATVFELLGLLERITQELFNINNAVEPIELFPDTTALSLELIDFSQFEIINGQIKGTQNELIKLAELVDQNLVSAFGHLENALVSAFKTGRLEIKSLVSAIALDLVQSLIRTVIVANLARAVLASFGNFFGATPTPVPGGGISPSFPGIPSFHSGGVIRYASPGLRSNEAFAILERGEEVITRTDPRHRWNLRGQNPDFLRWWISRLPRYHSGGVVGGTGSAPSPIGMPVEVRVINPPGEPVAEVQSSQAVLDSDKLVVSVMVRDAQRNGPITRTIRNIAKRG